MPYNPLEPEDISEHFGQYDGEVIQKQKHVIDGRVYEITDAGGGGGGGADDWGNQVVISDATLDGDGTTLSPLVANLAVEANNILRRKTGGGQAGKLTVKLRTRQALLTATGTDAVSAIAQNMSTDSMSSMLLNVRGMIWDQASEAPMFTVAQSGLTTVITVNPGVILDLPPIEPGDRVVAIWTEPYN